MIGATIVGEIPLASGEIAIVDLEDVPMLSQFRWFALRGPMTIYARGYRIGDAGRKTRTWVIMHRLLCPVEDGQEPDHRNGNGLDNRRANLRPGTRSQNNGNQRPGRRNRSGYRGVCWHRRTGKWTAQIHHGDKREYLGLFVDPWEAAQAYNAAATDKWGEFARLNERLDVE